MVGWPTCSVDPELQLMRPALSIGYSGITIENAVGSWRELPQLDLIFGMDPGYATSIGGHIVLVGEGGYDGLIAVADINPVAEGSEGRVLEGYILEMELPPLPDILAAD